MPAIIWLAEIQKYEMKFGQIPCTFIWGRPQSAQEEHKIESL